MSLLQTATRIEAERVRIENYAVGAIARVGDTALRHAASAVRLGASPTEAARDVLWGNATIRQPGIVEIIAQGLVGAHLLGLRRTALAAQQHYGREVITLSRASDNLGEWTKKLIGVAAIAESEVVGLFRRARMAAANLVQRITAPLLKRVDAVADAIDFQPAILPGIEVGDVGGSVPKFLATPRAAVQELGVQFEKAGFKTGAEHGIGTVVGGAMVRAYESGRSRGWRTPQIQEKLWGLRYSAIRDSRTTPLCRGLDGTVLPLADPFWEQWTPPNHYNCRSMVVEVWESSRLRPPKEIRGYQKFGADFFVG